MFKYLSQQWFDRGRELDATLDGFPGLDARLQYRVTDGPDGDITYYWIMVDGHLVEAHLGEIDDADVTITVTYADSAKAHRGEATMSEAIANGSVEGDVQLLARLGQLRSDDGHRGALAEMIRVTQY